LRDTPSPGKVAQILQKIEVRGGLEVFHQRKVFGISDLQKQVAAKSSWIR
jgi:hypothetical protein